MKARFAGKCFGGRHAVAAGDEIVPDRVGWSHPACVKPLSSGASLARTISRIDSGAPLRDEALPGETEWARDSRLFREAVAALTPAERAGWDAVMVDNEYFDGEDAIALGTLESLKARRALVGYRPRYDRGY